jgi:hypothetical protein
MTLLGLKKLILNPMQFGRDFINKYVYGQKVKKEGETSLDLRYINPLKRHIHLIHTGEDIIGESHLNLWIPHFVNSKVKFFILIRSYPLFEKMVEKYPLLDIVYAKESKDVIKLLAQLPYIKVCFYPSNTGNNLHLLQFNDLKHIFIGHGDSDKTASAHKYFRVYDENWVAGEAHIDRFRNEGFDFSGLKFVKVGRPNLRNILNHSKIGWKDRFGGKLNLLYLSTWEGVYKEQNYTSAYIINEFFDKIEKFNFSKLDIKLHPKIGTRDKRLENIDRSFKETLSKSRLNFKIHSKNIAVETLIKNSNVFICDISAVVSDSLSANAPIFVYIPKDRNIKLSHSKMDYKDYTYTFSDIETLMERLEDVIINGNDYLAVSRENAMEYILGRYETVNGEFIKRVRGLREK